MRYNMKYILIPTMEQQISMKTTKNDLNPEQINPQATRGCRICLDASSPLQQFCRCTGTIAHLHPECLRKWIINKLDTLSNVEEILKKGFPCELCGYAIPISITQTSRFKNCEEITERLNHKKPQALFFGLSLILTFSFIVLLLVFVLSKDLTSLTLGEIIGLIVAILLLLSSFTIISLMICIRFLRKRQRNIILERPPKSAPMNETLMQIEIAR